MAKRPVAGRVKRRLAREIGDVAALRFYRTALANTVMRLGADPRWRTYLAVTPDTSVTASCWPSPPKLTRISQGEGGLGQRMQSLFDRMPPGPVVIVGSDIPAVRPAHIARAFDLLGSADAVFGPATDGGYWLVGLKRSVRQLVPFEGVPWSTEETLAATVANLREELSPPRRHLATSTRYETIGASGSLANGSACYRRQLSGTPDVNLMQL